MGGVASPPYTATACTLPLIVICRMYYLRNSFQGFVQGFPFGVGEMLPVESCPQGRL